MNCLEARPLLDALVDGELPTEQAQLVQTHLVHCPACEQHAALLHTLLARLADDSLYQHAPVSLPGRVEAALDAPPPPSFLYYDLSPRMICIICSVLVLLSAGVWWAMQPDDNPRHKLSLAQQSLHAHQQAFQANRTTDFESSNAQAIHQWIKQKTSYVVSVKDLADKGYHLRGVRLEKTSKNTIPVVVYALDGQNIELYLWPIQCSSSLDSCHSPAYGVQLAGWADGEGFTRWAVSTLPQQRIDDFAQNAAKK